MARSIGHGCFWTTKQKTMSNSGALCAVSSALSLPSPTGFHFSSSSNLAQAQSLQSDVATTIASVYLTLMNYTPCEAERSPGGGPSRNLGALKARSCEEAWRLGVFESARSNRAGRKGVSDRNWSSMLSLDVPAWRPAGEPSPAVLSYPIPIECTIQGLLAGTCGYLRVTCA